MHEGVAPSGDSPSAEVPRRASRARRQSDVLRAEPVRVLCVDDHALLLEGLQAQFQLDGGVEMVGRLSCADRLVEEVRRLHPDVVVVDIEMPGSDVFEMCDRMRAETPGTPYVLLSAHVRDGYLAAAVQRGAAGYFAKSDDLDAIVSGLKKVARRSGDTFVLGAKVREHCVVEASTARRGGAGSAAPVTRLASLSNRELEVLRLIGKGLSRTEIARELCRSAKTIDGHQDRIMRKLDLGSRADLMRYAIREGLVEA